MVHAVGPFESTTSAWADVAESSAQTSAQRVSENAMLRFMPYPIALNERLTTICYWQMASDATIRLRYSQNLLLLAVTGEPRRAEG